MRRGLAAGLCLLLTCSGSPPARAAESGAPALLLAFHAADVAEEAARARMEKLSGLLLADLRVRWVRLPPQSGPPGTDAAPPEADGPALARISATLGGAARRMERMETRDAELLLEEAERRARAFRPTERLHPYLAEIFLRRGLLRLWEGNRAGAEEMFVRSRDLRPDFAPDPALFSPAFRETWARAAARGPAGAELLVQTIPAGADVFVDGARAGTTPARVRVPVLVPAVVRVARAGYLPVERTGHWLPGDSEMMDVALAPDRLFRLRQLLADSGGGAEAGAILAEMASSAGAERVAVFVLGGTAGEGRIRVLSVGPGDGEPRAAGEFAWPAGDDGERGAAASVGAMLAAAGWPAVSREPRAARPWYHKWWVWALLGAVVVGAAAGAGGSGGGSGGSTGAIGVTF